jgi:ABC-2 type transport system permease protein
MDYTKLKLMPAPKIAKTRSIVTGLLLSLALLFILNLLSSFFFYRLDFSKGKIHTLSKTSKNLVRKLSDNVVVKVYLSRNLPPDYNVLARYAKDLLGEYKQYGGKHFRFEFVSTNNEDEFSGAATRSNVFTQRVMILENDQQTVRDIFMGLAFEYKGNRETLNLTKDIEGRMEYEITAILRRLTKVTLLF